MLTFDEALHRYYWHGKPVPGVTSVIDDLLDWSAIPLEHRERVLAEGRAIHAMAEWHFAGELDAVPDWMAGRHRALLAFIEEKRFEPIAIEQRVYHPLHQYAGTLDLRGRMLYQGAQITAFLDIKRSLYGGRVTGVQIAAYQGAYAAENKGEGENDRRFALHLGADGKYRLEEFESRNDFGVFVACLTRHRFKERLQ